jgi:hypothetical protein
MPHPEPPASAITAATSTDWSTRADAAQQLAPWADRDDIAAILYGLLRDTADTAVTESACAALLARNDIQGTRLVARAVANAMNPEFLGRYDHVDHLHDTVSRHLLPEGPIEEFLNTCNTLAHDPDPDTAAGATELLQWARPWA